jgi:hypothetical protein
MPCDIGHFRLWIPAMVRSPFSHCVGQRQPKRFFALSSFRYDRLQEMKIVHWDTIEVGDFCEVDARKYLHMQILQSGKELNVEDDMWNEIFSVVGGNAGRGEKLVLIDTRRVK